MRRCPGLLLLPLVAGCGRLLEVSVTVQIPPEVQDLYSAEDPGWVILDFDHPDLERSIALTVLCEPKEDVRDFTYRAAGLGCAEPSWVQVWIEPWDKVGDPTCRANDFWLERDAEPDPGWARAGGLIWEDADVEACDKVDTEGLFLEVELPRFGDTETEGTDTGDTGI